MKKQRSMHLAVAAAVAGMVPALAQADILSAKRGFADVGASYNNLQATGAGWYYTWGTGAANPGNFDAKFYPMFWGAPGTTTINNTLATRPDYILGFNEPERSDQANLSVASAISSWTTISNSTNAYNTANGTSIKLVSPAVADTSGASGGQQWLANFMSQANANNLKVDAVAFHWYGVSTPSNPSGAASSFLSRVDSYHNSYGKPVFITEFAIHDWGGAYTDAEIIEANRQFLNIVIPGLESRSYVAGYSWYHWFSDAPLYSGSPMTPTPMAYSYVGAVGSGRTEDVGGKNLGEHVAYLAGGTLTQTGSPASLKYINALASTSNITGSIDWGLNASGNWLRVQPDATLRKSGANQISFTAGTVTNDGTLDVAQGVLRMGVSMLGSGTVNISSTGDGTGSTARLELTNNIGISRPINFAQRNDPAGSDGIRNVSGTSSLSGPMTITVGGNQARIRSDAGLLTLSGPISTNATSARNLYLQGAGNGAVSGVISDNPANSAGKINLSKEGGGIWTLTAPNTYTGNTTINGGVLRLGQQTATPVASYSFDSTSGSTVFNAGSGAGMNGALIGGASIVGGGRFGNAVSLNGGASVLINSPVIDMGTAANWTLSAWVKTATPGGSLLSKGNGSTWAHGNTIFYLGDGSGGGSGAIPSGVRYAGGFFQGSTGATSVGDNAWHMVTYVNSGGGWAIYVDGVFQSLSAGNSSFSVPDVGTVIRLGISTNTVAADGTVNYSGLLDSVQFYNQALSAAQIAAIYQGASATTTGLLPASTNVTIASGATLDVNGTMQQIATLNGPAGAAVTLGAGQLILDSPANSSFAGSISGVGGSLVKNSSGTLTLSGNNTYTGGTTVAGGTLIAERLSNGSLNIGAGALARVTPKGAPNSASGTTVIPALSIAAGGQLDLTNNSLVIDYVGSVGSLVDDTRMQLLDGRLTSSAADATHKLGYADNAVLAESSFGGVAVDASSILVKHTFTGDANLDGQVDITDLAALATAWQTAGPWTSGDFDYSGFIDITDLAALATNWQAGVGVPAVMSFEQAMASLGLSGVAVPEPALAIAILLAGTGLRRRR